VSSIVALEDTELIPVLELAPYDFRADDRPTPSGIYQDMPEEWYRYWLDSLADSAITGLMPVQRGSWNVPTSEFTDPTLLGAGGDLPKTAGKRIAAGGVAAEWGSRLALPIPECAGRAGLLRWPRGRCWLAKSGWLQAGRVATASDRPSVAVGTVSCSAIDHQWSTRGSRASYGMLGRLPGPTSSRSCRGGDRTRAICWTNRRRPAFTL
jgi:hypothetical protein